MADWESYTEELLWGAMVEYVTWVALNTYVRVARLINIRLRDFSNNVMFE